jgi:hypothetical protein
VFGAKELDGGASHVLMMEAMSARRQRSASSLQFKPEHGMKK